MTTTIVPVYVTLPVGCDAMQIRHDIASATTTEALWSSSGCTSMAGGDGTSLRERTSYYSCMGDAQAKRFCEIVKTHFPSAAVIAGEDNRRFRHGRVYRLHTYHHETGPGHCDYVYVQGATRRSPPAFRLVDDNTKAEPMKCKSVTVAAPGLVGEAAITPHGGLIFAAHEVTASDAPAR